MIFDPIEYLMNAETRRRDVDAARLMQLSQIEAKQIDHETRINSLELWRRSAVKTVRKWPYIAVPAVLVLANIAPDETVQAAIKILKVLV